MTPLAADRAEIARFVNTIFPHADEGGFVSLRTFEHERGRPPVEIRAVQINGEGLEPLIAQATGGATRAARHPRPAVFAPIVCTFSDAGTADEANVRNGVALFVDLDEADPRAGRERLEGLLGPASAVVASGGVWTDPTTGEVQDRLHLYWVLGEPTRTAEEHRELKRACRLAAALVGGDPSAVPLNHPMRWPGSWHRKGEPRLARGRYTGAEVHLDDVLDRLEQAAALALEHAAGEAAERLRTALEMREDGQRREAPEYDPRARDPDLEALADAIPNEDAPRAEYVSIGLAFFAADGGSAAAFNAWDRWARKSGKYHGGTATQWAQFAKSPPDRTGKGALVKRARRHDPAFRLPSWGPGREEAAGDGTWRDPEPLSEAEEPAPFPLGALPGDVEAAVVEYRSYGGQPVELVAAAALAAMSAAVQGHVDVRRDGQLCGPVSVNTLVVADSGERKTGCDNAFSAAAERWARAEAKRLGAELAKAKDAREAHNAHKQGLLAAIRETAAKGKKAGGGLHKVENQADLEALKKQLKDHARGLPPLPPQPTPRIENGTAEGVTNVLRFAWPAVAWASGEGANVTGGHGFKDDALPRTLAFLNSRWDGAPIDRARAAEDYSKVYGRRLTVSLMLQPAAFEAFRAAGGGLARGLGNLARMLVAWPRSTMGTRLRDEDGADPELPALGRFLARAEELHRLPLPMPFDMETMEAGEGEDDNPVVDPLELSPRELPLGSEARRLWIRYLNECEVELAPEGEFAEVRDVAAKSAENACRLAAIFHVWRHGPDAEVGAIDMARGVEIARWFLFEARRILAGAGEDHATPERVADAEVLARWIDARDEAPTLKDVLRLAPSRLRSKGRRDAAIALLRERHWLRHERRAGRLVLVLNPHLPWED